MSASYPYRRSGIAVRVMNALCALLSLLAAAVWLASHHLMLAVVSLVTAAIWVCAFVFNTKVAARRRARFLEANRPRPDYALIAAMEREVWETFHHDGAPEIGYGQKGHTISGPLHLTGITMAEFAAGVGNLSEALGRAKAREQR